MRVEESLDAAMTVDYGNQVNILTKYVGIPQTINFCSRTLI